jgi:uncharacterized membrane protein YtjA (UPF0391 family)
VCHRGLGMYFEIKGAHHTEVMRFIVKGGEIMLGWAVTFLIIALVAAVFGFGGIAAASAGIAKFLFFLFLVMCVIFFFLGWRGRRVP